jgi:hypothetical protein
MKLQMCFVDKVLGQAHWLDFEPKGLVLPTGGEPDEVLRVVSQIVLPPGMSGLRVVTDKEVWTFQYHSEYGCVPRLRDDGGDIVEVWPSNTQVGGIWEIQHVLPDGHLLPMMYVEPCGNFQMGDAESTNRRRVSVPGGFMATTPTTVRQWNWFAAATGKTPKATTTTAKDGTTVDLTDHPVTEVSYWDACEFANWAGVGLPTEEQWEHAARGNDGRKFPWGNEPPTDDRCHSSVQTQQERTAAVCLPDGTPARPKGASPYGILDASGNVWEWMCTVHK